MGQWYVPKAKSHHVIEERSVAYERSNLGCAVRFVRSYCVEGHFCVEKLLLIGLVIPKSDGSRDFEAITRRLRV